MTLPSRLRRGGAPTFQLCCLAGGLLLTLGGCRTPELRSFEETRSAMGTVFRVVLYERDEARAREAFDAAFARIEGLDEALSDYRPQSELRRLSSDGTPGLATPVSEDLYRVLAQAEQISRRTGGAFDITVGPLVRLWRRASRQGELPEALDLAEARERVGWRRVVLHESPSRVQLQVPDMRLDLGGIAKGYALDQALQALTDLGVRSALVEGGGDVAVSEAPPGRRVWRVLVAPDGAESHQVLVELVRAAVATSGDLYQRLVVDGVAYSHIVDPRTGRALIGGRSASVIAATGMQADALASALCVSGVPGVADYIESLAGVEARVLWTDVEKGQTLSCESSGWGKMMVSQSGGTSEAHVSSQETPPKPPPPTP